VDGRPDILPVGVMVRMALEEVEDKDGGVCAVGSEGVEVDASVGAVHATGYSYCGNAADASWPQCGGCCRCWCHPWVLFLL
jgi:hypothetical protein